MSAPTLTPWPGSQPPSERELGAIFDREGLAPRWWSNAPGDRYGEHSHRYHKVLYCARGSIRFDTAAGPFELAAGDRLDIPAGAGHSAVVGPRGVTCVEAGRA